MITEPELGLGCEKEEVEGLEKVGAEGWGGRETEGLLGGLRLLKGLNLLAVLMKLEKNPPCPLTEVISPRQRARLTQRSFIVSRLNCWRVEIQLRGGETTPK